MCGAVVDVRVVGFYSLVGGGAVLDPLWVLPGWMGQGIGRTLFEDAVRRAGASGGAIVVPEDLRALGLHLSIDDFGTGYSSLSYLKRFPVDHLKIDQSFVREMARDDFDATIVTPIIGLGHNLGLRLIAEGVETAEQLAYLRDGGRDIVQGHFLGLPLPADRLQKRLAP